MSDPADLGIVDATALLRARRLSSSELVGACLARVRERDGSHSHEGDPGSINAWVRVYEEDALAAAARADRLLASGGDRTVPPLCGIPLGLKDLYAVKGKPLTGSSLVLADVPDRDSDVWARLEAAGAVLLGHLHTHELAIGGTTDQVGNPWALERSAGGSSGGSAAALAARMVPGATGTDTAGSLRIPSAMCGTSTIKPTRGLVSLAGVVPLAVSLDHAGPMARTIADCALLLAAMAGPDDGRPQSALVPAPGSPPASRARLRPLAGLRVALSPRIGMVELEADVAVCFDGALAACGRLGAELVEPPPPSAPLDVGEDYLDVLYAELLAYHRRFDDRRDRYRPSIREWVEQGERRATAAEAYVAAQTRRRDATARWAEWLREHRIDAVVEPTIPVTAPLRGDGYEHAGSDYVLISLTHYWDWIGFPVVTLPSGLGASTGLPCGVSLVGAAGADWELLAGGIALQAELGVPEPPLAIDARRDAS